jgi:aspartyl-tRNA(Asn)/glutamyl-tRNA(Gln) amidotransferase subunit B
VKALQYEPVIGLEVHAQLRTRTKIFCGCTPTFGAPANTHTCPVCLGHPGALPVLNRHAVELAARGALALDCELPATSVFSRKNYFYPDLPKGYQITQFDRPIALGGRVPVEVEDGPREVLLTRIHMEEDAGKLIHDGMPDEGRASWVDLNRAGTPLIEIVSEPVMHSPREAYLYLQRLRSILRYTGVCDGNMEEGSFRCDANISLRPAGSTELGTRTELKNLNSFRNVERALTYEIERQAGILRAGAAVEQQTVLWDAGVGETRPMRGKEEAHDYRYFPEPDLLPLTLEPDWIESLRGDLPELPEERKRRFVDDLGVPPIDAHQLTLERPVAEFFERVATLSGDPRAASNWMIHDLQRAQNEAGKDWGDISMGPEVLAELIALVADDTVSATVARRELFPVAHATGRSPREIARERGLEQVSDDAALAAIVQEVAAAHPQQVAQYRAGKTGLLGFLVGKVMQASGGKANPKRVNALMVELLEESTD